ncbi:hypothetical protein [Streptomyces virginiae]|uniref:Uncharacterized protein n=1 Tax=Streptomyces virginiae TaxID=1961 RepID=A0ABZ1T396_STRVG|nr:hypothetical protein [Streptomyces virginiae]
MRGAPGEGTAWGTPPDLAADPLIESVTRTATAVLRPDAERTAVEVISRAQLDEPARCGC